MVPHSSSTARSNGSALADKPVTDSLQHDVLGHERRRGLKFPYALLKHVLACGDASLIVLASLLGGGFYQLIANANSGEPSFGAGAIAALLYVLLGQLSGLYDSRAVFSKRRDAGQIVTNWLLVGFLLTTLAFLLKIGSIFSRGSVICFAVLALAFLIVSRGLFKRLVAGVIEEGQVQGRRAIVLGTREELAAIDSSELLEAFGSSELRRIVFSYDKNKSFSLSDEEARTVDAAIHAAREWRAHEIVLALSWVDTRKIELVRDRLRDTPLPVQLLPDRKIRSLTKNPSFRLGNSLSVEIKRGPLSSSEQLAKRAVDIVGAGLALILLLPLILLTAVAIKLDSPGPVLFRQRRKGLNSREFVIFKFRSMSVMEDGASVVQAQRRDPRVTRVGRVLRKTSIDELPQLLNVLIGNMSLVGPRPHALAHDNHYGDLLSDYAFRHHVKPGITGWAQVKGYRGETSRVELMEERVDCDLWYINNWSLLLDFKIMALTFFEVARRRNAY